MLDSTHKKKLFMQYLKIAQLSALILKILSLQLLAQSYKKQNIFKIKKKDTKATSINCMFIFILILNIFHTVF